jgi:GNAT superfamily N-acetyltransferase
MKDGHIRGFPVPYRDQRVHHPGTPPEHVDAGSRRHCRARRAATRGTRATVVRADPADLDVLSRVIADASCDLAPSRWLIADPGARAEIFPRYFRLYLEDAMASGIVYTTPDRTAAALRVYAGEEGAGQADGYGTRLAAVTRRWTGRFAAFDATLDRHQPAGVAHWHLIILAVRPDRQGRGHGTALLRAGHARLDDQGLPAYLEASGSRSRDLYLAPGYELRPDAPFYLLEGGPPVWPMMRKPVVP